MHLALRKGKPTSDVVIVVTNVNKRYRVFTRSSKRPVNLQHYGCWKFAGRSGSCKHPIRPI